MRATSQGRSQRLDEIRRQQAARGNAHRHNGNQLDRQRRLERREALRREIQMKRAQIARLKARQRPGIGVAMPEATPGTTPDPQETEPQEQGDPASKLVELQGMLEQLIAALGGEGGQDESEDSESPSGQDQSDEGEDEPESPSEREEAEVAEQPEAESAAARPGGQWQSMPPRGRE